MEEVAADSLPRHSAPLHRYILILLAVLPLPLHAQTSGSIIGRVVDAQSGDAIVAATIEVANTSLRALSGDDGRFIIGAVPPGERSLRIEHLGFKPVVLEGIIIRTGRTQDLRIEMTVAPVAVAGVIVQAERVRLIEPEVSATHDIIVRRELRELPVDRLQQVIELTPGVSGGHFRGGRVGQEVHVVDGIELKNQLEASNQGMGLELAPTSLEELEVITGGFGAQYGSALSGVVSYVTRRGDEERWDARTSLMTDQWAPASMFSGFTALSVSAGGPVPFLGGGTTLFVDVLGQGMIDAEPRARGLTCLTESDVDRDVAAQIGALRSGAPSLACPYEHSMLPHQRGDKLIGFARLDRQLTSNLRLYTTILRNRNQRELYTSEFRYNETHQLGQRTTGTLGTLNLDWARNTQTRAYQVSGRLAWMRLDRYLGVVDPTTFDGTRIGGFGLNAFSFLGENYARSSIDEQLAAPQPMPGYEAPSGSGAGPFGYAGSGIFFTEGTPHLTNWTRTDLLSGDLVTQLMSLAGSSLRAGASTKIYRVESYERAFSHLAGSLPSYARFYPATFSGFTETTIGVADEMTINIGVRVDAFRSGISFQADRSDVLSPVIDPQWNMSVNPRFGVAMPVPGTNNAAALRFNYGYVSQPPDFRYFLDTTVGDSLRTDIRRQGNPSLSFERGKSYEMGVSALLGANTGASVAIFRKELSELVSGSMRLGSTGDQLFSTDDEGTVQGVELSLRARWSSLSVRGSWALQKAVGVASGTDSDSLITGDRRFVTYPLAFDRRHSIDVAVFYGRAAGAAESGWSAALTSGVKSGYPIDRIAAGGGAEVRTTYLPWTSTIDLRLTRELGRLPICGGCEWRVSADGRNLMGRENIIAARRDTGGLGPTLAAIRAIVDAIPVPTEIPVESPLYSANMDLDRNGVITADEFRLARTAAALSRFDPSLFFGEPRQLRLGFEVSF